MNIKNALKVNLHRWLRGLVGSLILFDPHAFASQRQLLYLLQIHKVPDSCLRFRSSSWYLWISPLLQEFHYPLTYSRLALILNHLLSSRTLSILHTMMKYPDREGLRPHKEDRCISEIRGLVRLHALYAQSFWITLAPSVLPRLLARS